MKYEEFKAKYLTKTIGKSRIDLNFEIGSSVGKIKGQHSVTDDLKLVNPNFKTDSDKWRRNCGKCVVAYEARRKGLDVEALPRIGKNDPLRMVKNWLSAFDYKTSDLRKCTGSNATEIVKSIKEFMIKQGEGARAIISLQWNPIKQKNLTGHAMFAETIGKDIVKISDPQSGLFEAEFMLEDALLDSVIILRVDNLELTEEAKKCYQKRRQ